MVTLNTSNRFADKFIVISEMYSVFSLKCFYLMYLTCVYIFLEYYVHGNITSDNATSVFHLLSNSPAGNAFNAIFNRRSIVGIVIRPRNSDLFRGE